MSRIAQHALVGLALGTLLATHVAAADAAPSGRIKILPQVMVADAMVHLSDLAQLDGSAVDLGGTEIGAAPEPGATRRISGQSVLAQLRAAGLDESITYTIPAAVSVTRAHQVIDENALRPVVEAQLGERLPPGDRVDLVEVQRPVRIPLGPYEVEVGAPAAQATGGGFRRTDVRILQDGVGVASVPARVKIASFGPVVVLRQPVMRGAVLRAEDLRVEERRLDDLPTTVVGELDEAIGKEARVALAAGKPLSLQSLNTAAMVKRGDLVRLMIEKNGLRLSVSGEALETAGVGERVRVLNDSSKRELVGRVVDHGTVHVVY